MLRPSATTAEKGAPLGSRSRIAQSGVRIQARPLGHGRAGQAPAHLETQIPVHRSGGVLLDDEGAAAALPARPLRDGCREGFRRAAPIAFAVIILRRVVQHAIDDSSGDTLDSRPIQ